MKDARICVLRGVAVILLGFSLAEAHSQVIFSDNFQGGPSSSWSNLRGAWTASNGVYFATQPNNNPATFSSLPFVLQNFTVDVDVDQVADGGIWLRSDASGTNGVLLVTGGNGWGSGNRGGNAGTSMYWHVITDANYNNPPKLNEVFNVITNPGVENIHLRVQVIGNQYSAFINGSTNAITSLVDSSSTYASGRVGLYDFSQQTFGNFILQIPPGFGPYNLAIRSAAPQLATISWTTNAVGWNLESAAALVGSTWQPVTNTPSIVATNFSVTLNATNTRFFRLFKP
ncbi:MAG TPA: hypothetical protein VKY92_11615 [Verrucomicrobiae bacterium]|nr:hypothetical protein [Verrucomicrobiae bacterium]